MTWVYYPITNLKGDIKGFTKVDKKMLPMLSKYNWNTINKGYVKCNFKGKNIMMHRLIMNEDDPNVIIDHKNNDTLDNRKCNLRRATLQMNSMNRTKIKNTSSKYKGVCWEGCKNKWQSYIKMDGKKYLLGYFDNEKQAGELYDLNARKFFKNFANLNFPEKKKLSDYSIKNMIVEGKKSKFGDPNYNALIRKI